jgi:hypothetical protein
MTLAQRYSFTFMVVLLVIIVATEILDISLNKIYLFIRSFEFSAYWNILIFVFIILVYVVGQHFILKYVKSGENIKGEKRLHYSIIHRIMKVSQYALIAILFVVTLQMIITSHYNTRFLICSIWISYSLAIFMLGFLARIFLSWFKSKKNIVVLLYASSTVALAFDAVISLVLNTIVIVGQPVESEQLVGGESAFIPYNILPLNEVFYLASIVSFILTWIATVLVLRYQSRRLGLIKYWIIVSIPLVYFLTQFQPLLTYFLFSTGFGATISYIIIYTIIFSASKPAGGILFAAGFWTMASKIKNNQLKAYMIISAYGLALIFGSDQASILTNRPYPPFGLASVSFLGLASYLVFIGIYSSVISLAQDSSLRQLIRSSIERSSNLLDIIATAHMEKEIVANIARILKKQSDEMTKETGITPSLDDAEIKQYVDDVISEVKKIKTNQEDR